MLRNLIVFVTRNTVLADMVGLCLLTGAAYIQYGTAAAMAASGGALLAIRLLADASNGPPPNAS